MFLSSLNRNQSNFHILYYFYDAMVADNELKTFTLNEGRSYRYLRIDPDITTDTKMQFCRNDADGNVTKFHEFEQNLKDLDFDPEQIVSIRKVLAAILILGNVRFNDEDKYAAIENVEEARAVAALLGVDEKKFEWSLINYCLIRSGNAEKRNHTADEARDARDVLAATIYGRLVDWIANIVNQKFAIGRAVL